MDETFNEDDLAMAENNSVASIEFIEPSLNVYDFQEEFNESLMINYQVLKLNNSILLWIGSNDSPKFNDLSLAMKSPYDTLPLTSRILGQSNDALPSLNLASRLSKRLDKPVYVSFNIPIDRLTLPDIEKRLLEEIKKKPDIF